MKKKNIISLVLIAVLVSIVGLFFFSQKNNQDEQVNIPAVQITQNNAVLNSAAPIYQKFIHKDGTSTILESDNTKDVISLLEDEIVDFDDGDIVSLSIEGKLSDNQIVIYKINKNNLSLTSDKEIDISKAETITIKDNFTIEPGYVYIYLHQENIAPNIFKETKLYYAFLVK